MTMGKGKRQTIGVCCCSSAVLAKKVNRFLKDGYISQGNNVNNGQHNDAKPVMFVDVSLLC